eukprot:2704983-Prymnesium_polylepis.1
MDPPPHAAFCLDRRLGHVPIDDEKPTQAAHKCALRAALRAAAARASVGATAQRRRQTARADVKPQNRD